MIPWTLCPFYDARQGYPAPPDGGGWLKGGLPVEGISTARRITCEQYQNAPFLP